MGTKVHMDLNEQVRSHLQRTEQSLRLVCSKCLKMVADSEQDTYGLHFIEPRCNWIFHLGVGLLYAMGKGFCARQITAGEKIQHQPLALDAMQGWMRLEHAHSLGPQN